MPPGTKMSSIIRKLAMLQSAGRIMTEAELNKDKTLKAQVQERYHFLLRKWRGLLPAERARAREQAELYVACGGDTMEFIKQQSKKKEEELDAEA